MTERQILLVKNSWSYVIVKSEEAGQLFYHRLFEIAPELKSLFKSEPKGQSRKLINMVTLMVSKLQKLDEIQGEIKSLATRHHKYGVDPAYYRIVGAAFLWTLQQGLKDKWNEELEEAWVDMYAVISNAMIKNQQAVAA
ncbi:globin domain-containing protein [Pseudochryseolinea flava]|uniref:Hemin receptor n=1 Tax=Pseudochryseolinea flava TaxID=2059302 RepID=A0A364XZ55_9BACT|nr:globin domain-containing protein [Pseudochryseolinea flava]RAV99089.1 hemin receptor [Pseudochryseolinea flava]